MKDDKFTNRLIHEKSPYLLQHAHNPVNWYPWGEEAFETARKHNKPVFLSIGYSTCHWCHVMARESFEDPEIADMLNEKFVAVKVDREERPDIDAVYMEACQMMTGTGGWPLTVITTPEGEPFFAGTYFPAEDRAGMPGLKTILERVALLWERDPGTVIETAGDVVRALKKQSRPGDVRLEIVERAFEALKRGFDRTHGGFGSGQKFPVPQHIHFLLRHHIKRKDEVALEMVNLTLERMRYGGIYDHLGYGFHRYAVEPSWTIPHFEKMLYDQALILTAYLDAFSVTGRELYRDTSLEITEYVLRDMQSPAGGFYSAEDAESEGVEGKYYLWRASEIRELLGDEAPLVMSYFNVLEDGNCAGELRGENILHVRSPEKVAEEYGITTDELRERIDNARRVLLERRLERTPPSRDDKVLTDWNGLMIGALARCHRITGSPEALKSSRKCLGFIRNNLWVDGRLMHRYREGEAAIGGSLDDHAFLIWGLLEMYDATFKEKYLKMALELSEVLKENFMAPDGGFYFTNDSCGLIVRRKDSLEGAIPSGNSVHMLNLLRLGSILEDDELTRMARGIVSAFASRIKSAPSAHTFLLSHLEWALKGGRSLTVICPHTPGILEGLRRELIPDFTITLKDEASDWSFAPGHLRSKGMVNGKCTYYLCDPEKCYPPSTDDNEILEYIRGV